MSKNSSKDSEKESSEKFDTLLSVNMEIKRNAHTTMHFCLDVLFLTQKILQQHGIMDMFKLRSPQLQELAIRVDTLSKNTLKSIVTVMDETQNLLSCLEGRVLDRQRLKGLYERCLDIQRDRDWET